MNGKIECLSKIGWWKNASPSPSIGHQTMEPSISHQVFLSHPSFYFSLKGWIRIIGGFFFSDIIFDLSLENSCSYKRPWEEKKN
jgi:hypothetical protein